MLKKLIEKAQNLDAEILKEHSQRKEIIESEEFKALGRIIASAMEEQQGLLETVPNSTSELIEVKQKITNIFREKEIEEFDNCFAKFETKKSVNSTKLLDVIGGDIDLFATLSQVSQKSLKEYAKDNKDIKKAILGCIQIDERKLVDITIKYS